MAHLAGKCSIRIGSSYSAIDISLDYNAVAKIFMLSLGRGFDPYLDNIVLKFVKSGETDILLTDGGNIIKKDPSIYIDYLFGRITIPDTVLFGGFTAHELITSEGWALQVSGSLLTNTLLGDVREHSIELTSDSIDCTTYDTAAIHTDKQYVQGYKDLSWNVKRLSRTSTDNTLENLFASALYFMVEYLSPTINAQNQRVRKRALVNAETINQSGSVSDQEQFDLTFKIAASDIGKQYSHIVY